MVVSFEELDSADLIVDAIYQGGSTGNISDDPLTRLLNCGNQGGFRKVGKKPNYVVLYSSMADPDWPDHLQAEVGLFTYYGDNKRPGQELHGTKPGGNRLLAEVFSQLHSKPSARSEIPPFLVFTKANMIGLGSRSVQFKGVAVPGASGVPPTDDIVAIWKVTNGSRFQNYRALFTILDCARVSRSWLDDLRKNNPLSNNCPSSWTTWVKRGKYIPMISEPTVAYRTVLQQLPSNDVERDVLLAVYRYFRYKPIAFERCAAAIAQMLDSNIIVNMITRSAVDGGRDAIGGYRIGPVSDSILLDFSLEAKCYCPGLDPGDQLRTVGVRETSRLISRLRHREFGILVTTSAVSKQAYEELRIDRHPVILICAVDIAQILISKGLNSSEKVEAWLSREFPEVCATPPMYS